MFRNSISRPSSYFLDILLLYVCSYDFTIVNCTIVFHIFTYCISILITLWVSGNFKFWLTFCTSFNDRDFILSHYVNNNYKYDYTASVYGIVVKKILFIDTSSLCLVALWVYFNIVSFKMVFDNKIKIKGSNKQNVFLSAWRFKVNSNKFWNRHSYVNHTRKD